MIESLNVLREHQSQEATLHRHECALEQQLIREIQCLERQLERMREREHLLEADTITTYEDMIDARRSMLGNLATDITLGE